MVTGIFMVSKETYMCSNKVALKFSKTGTVAVAYNSFAYTDKPLKDYDEIDGLIKYDNAPAMRFKGFVKNVRMKGEVQVQIVSELTTLGVPELFAIIGNFSLYLSSEKP